MAVKRKELGGLRINARILTGMLASAVDKQWLGEKRLCGQYCQGTFFADLWLIRTMVLISSYKGEMKYGKGGLQIKGDI